MSQMKYNTRRWLNAVYRKVGLDSFQVRELGVELYDKGAIQNAHRDGYTVRVGKARGNRSVWKLNERLVENWYLVEVPA